MDGVRGVIKGEGVPEGRDGRRDAWDDGAGRTDGRMDEEEGGG